MANYVEKLYGFGKRIKRSVRESYIQGKTMIKNFPQWAKEQYKWGTPKSKRNYSALGTTTLSIPIVFLLTHDIDFALYASPITFAVSLLFANAYFESRN